MVLDSNNIPYQVPFNYEAECQLLGQLIGRRGSITAVDSWLSAPDFFDSRHQIVFLAAVETFRRGQQITVESLEVTLSNRGQLSDAGGREYVDILASCYDPSTSWQTLARIVREMSSLRGLQSTALEIVKICGENDFTAAIKFATDKIMSHDKRANRSGNTQLREVLMETYGGIEYRYSHGRYGTGMSSGFMELDQLTTGFHPGDLIMLAGRPDAGKTALALSIARNASLMGRTTVLYVSLDEPSTELTTRLLGAESIVSVDSIRRGTLADLDWQRLSTGLGTLAECSILLNYLPECSLEQLKDLVRSAYSEYGLGLIVVDHVQLLGIRRGSSAEQHEPSAVIDISRALKALARTYSVPVIAISQLPKSLEYRDDKLPRVSDLRELGPWDEEADVIMLLYRDEQYHPYTLNKNIIAIGVEKSAHGPVGRVDLHFVPEIQKIFGIERV